MKRLIILFTSILLCGCDHVKKDTTNPLKIKATNVQRCLDSIYSNSKDWACVGYKMILVKDDQNTKGLDSLHIGPNKIHLEKLPKEINLFKVDPNVNRTVYTRVSYKQISETSIDVKIVIFFTYADWDYRLYKTDDKWMIEKVASGID